MTREELILSDEYLVSYIECIVVSGKPVKKTRQELLEFMKAWRDEVMKSLKEDKMPNIPGIDKSEVIPVKPIVVKENFSNWESVKGEFGPLELKVYSREFPEIKFKK